MQRRMITLSVAVGVAMMLVSSAAVAQYSITNLDSNQAGRARNIDPELANGWGLARAAGSPFWVSDAGSGWSTLYNGVGEKQALEVTVPTASGKGKGSPTGIVFNGSKEFQIKGAPALFLFATLDGTISGWNPGVNPTAAVIAVNNSSAGAVYTGLAITSNASGNMLFAADNANGKIDMYNGSFALVNSFTDPTIPAGFSPFGIQDIDGLVFVSFASTSGATGGYVDIYSENGVWLKRLISGSFLNNPWGFAAAPSNFGPLSNTLLVSNNVHGGTINAYNALTGQFVGTVKDTSGKNIHIDLLWGIEFGGGSAANGGLNELFFTAGPDNYQAGTFGVIKAVAQ
jgi:uncharacterized protein (TIGR03118 family)